MMTFSMRLSTLTCYDSKRLCIVCCVHTYYIIMLCCVHTYYIWWSVLLYRMLCSHILYMVMCASVSYVVHIHRMPSTRHLQHSAFAFMDGTALAWFTLPAVTRIYALLPEHGACIPGFMNTILKTELFPYTNIAIILARK